MKKLVLFLSIVSLISCEKEVVSTRILDGTYDVESKVWIEADGTEKLFVPIGTDITELDITGWMSECKLTFQGDSLNIALLMDQGWDDGWVDVEWMKDVPHRVGCHYVHSVSEKHIAWFQDDVIIKWNLK